ncbi:B-cell receptor CD22-like [Salvelinus sp. IW2-2015]|uniref:B-cell receptor CD22-like n=1 Tax=Salvelinus sp. IW2-2015 TaxID=2691554 RepID=UPI000CEABBEA|nr:sialic acid-binding Ig-like lectin 14 [Salvelinus alpinus]XP_023992153.1 sialic acid-binding Ig-like lectin 14 [Salvelinus alpinus]XP_023992154.1 sialic acid-binding Ig-like lectin 14 [Salvelinus alpinus]
MGIEQLLWHFLTHCFWLGGMGVDTSSWTAEVPSSVSGLQGSPIVIPCSFNYPEPEKKPAEFTGIWLKDKNEVIYHKDSSKIIQDYKGRTELVGDLLQKNCSLRINPLHCSDEGPFTFRIEIKDYNKYSYKEDTVSIVVCSSPGPPSLSVMEEVKVGEEVSASCSVSHSCPSDSPRITWSHSGISSVQSQQLTKGQWEVTSSLTFNPSSTDHNQSLVCTAAYRGGETTKTLKTLNVKYAPVDVKVKGVSSVKEGDSVELRCSSDSNPAAHSYRWHNSRGPLPTTGPTLTLENVTRLTEALYCTAINTEGQGQSSPLKLNVEYPPEIKVGSACTSDISMVTCLCIVNLEPPGTVEWSLPAEPLPTLPSTRLERHGSVTMVILQRALGFSETVHCHASNTQGNATLSFTVSTNDKMLMLYVSIGIAALVVVVILVPMSALLLNKKGGRSRSDLPVTSKQDMDASKCASSDPSTSRKEQKDTSSEINTNYYTNNHLYGNIEAEEDGDPFECEGGDDSVYGNM